MDRRVLLHDDELNEEKEFTMTLDEPDSILNSFQRCLQKISKLCSISFRHAASPPHDASSHYLHSSGSFIYAALLYLLPRFLRRGGLRQTKRLHDTSYLDALRGWAAFIVWIGHTFPYKGYPIFQLPFLHAIVHGRAMVMVFFVISGYALSYRMLKLMRTRQALGLLDTFISSIFRRFIRLYGSTGAATFIAMLLVWFRFCIPDLRQETFPLQVRHWMADFAHFSYPLAPNVDGYVHSGALVSAYLGVTWTIPIEFRGSMLLFLFCIGTCKLSTRNRMALCWFFIICSYLYQVVYVGMFLGGLFIADLSFTRHPERLNPPSHLPVNSDAATEHQEPPRQSRRSKIFYSAVLILAIFFLSQPAGRELPREYWPWPALEKVVPSFWAGWRMRELWWLSIGSFLLVWALDACPMLQTPFRWNVSQYIGELSFGIYITHYLVVWTVWECILFPLRNAWLGNAAWTVAPFVVIHFFIMLWAADLFIRLDKKVINFARWCQTKCFVW